MTVNDADRPGPPSGDDHPPGSAPLVGFLELFYDLVFVAATMVLSNSFSFRASWGWALTCGLMFTMLWLLWFNTTTLMNVERVDDFGHRALVLVQMLLITLTVLAFADKDTSNHDLLGVTYGLALSVVALMHHRAARRNPECAPWARERRNRLLLAAGLSVLTTFSGDVVDDLAFLVVIVLLVVPTALGTRRRMPLPPVDTHHMLDGLLGERSPIGPLTIARLGTAVLVVALGVTSWRFGWLTPGGLLLCLAGLAIAHVAVARRLRVGTSAPVLH